MGLLLLVHLSNNSLANLASFNLVAATFTVKLRENEAEERVQRFPFLNKFSHKRKRGINYRPNT